MYCICISTCICTATVCSVYASLLVLGFLVDFSVWGEMLDVLSIFSLPTYVLYYSVLCVLWGGEDIC